MIELEHFILCASNSLFLFNNNKLKCSYEVGYHRDCCIKNRASPESENSGLMPTLTSVLLHYVADIAILDMRASEE